jgi:hypothetical protein
MNLLLSVSRLFRALSSDSIQSPDSQASAGRWQGEEIIEFWMERVVNDDIVERAPADLLGSESDRHQSFA